MRDCDLGTMGLLAWTDWVLCQVWGVPPCSANLLDLHTCVSTALRRAMDAVAAPPDSPATPRTATKARSVAVAEFIATIQSNCVPFYVHEVGPQCCVGKAIRWLV